jgi:hypothetical protein
LGDFVSIGKIKIKKEREMCGVRGGEIKGVCE